MINKRLIYGIVFCLYIVAVAVLCFMKTDGLPEIGNSFLGLPMDKIAHFLMFLPFPVLASLTFIDDSLRLGNALAVLAVILVTGTGMAYGTEQLQALTGYRSNDLADFLADLTGLCTGAALTAIYLHINDRRR